MTEIPTIPEFYRDKTVFITGGSGFIGKVLIEKLLRSCPDVKRIYLLMREKKGRSPEERLEALTNVELFDLIRSKNSEALKKLKIVNGDVKDLKLGLSKEDWEMLVQEVNIVFHVAASVRFDLTLTDAILMNTRGTREIADLALQAKKLDVFFHVSTTYCHTDKKVIEEKMYPPHGDWRKSIEIAETVDKNTLNALTEKYIHPLPNTYTYTKSLAEQVVNDMCSGRIPAVIFRPTIVWHSSTEPIRGWVDGWSGFVALETAVATGIMRIVYGNPNIFFDCLSVDFSVKMMIIASWLQTILDEKQKLSVSVYNASNNQVITTTHRKGLEKILGLMETESPFDQVLWYPRLAYTSCYYNYKIQTLLYQVLPALLLDGILRLRGKKTMFTKLQRTIFVTMAAVALYNQIQWQFKNEKALTLRNKLLPADLASFDYNLTEIDLDEYFKDGVVGIKKYLLKENFDLDKSKRKLRKMKMASQILNALWYLMLFWLVFVKFDLVSVIFGMLKTFLVNKK